MSLEHAIDIKVNNISKMMGKNQALKSLTLNFEAGLMHGIIGPEGAGKTTLMRMLCGLLKPDSGEICYEYLRAQVAFNTIRDQIAYMPQTQSLYPDLSIEEHLNFFRELYAIPRGIYQKKREELLAITRLGEFLDRPARQLSGGMYKKLGLMCALLRAPHVLLLDEPTNGVDPISRREFWDLLYVLVEQGILVILTTAYMDEAERCGKVHLLDSGKLLADGEPSQILEREKVRDFNELFVRHVT